MQGAFSWRRIVWKNAATPRSLFILWLTILIILPTADRLVSWHVQCNPMCVFCGVVQESIDHFFFECSFTGSVWNGLLRQLQIHRPSSNFSDSCAHAMRVSKRSSAKCKLCLVLFA